MIDKFIVVNIARQALTLYQSGTPYNPSALKAHTRIKACAKTPTNLIKTYSISTAKNGIGSLEGSGCTPLGTHNIAKKIGDNVPMNSVFVGRELTGEVYNDALGKQHPKRDWILSRILWLSGCEVGANKGRIKNSNTSCDTFARYIYIHGTPDTEPMGVPLSHGCIRMRNHDIIELYDIVEEGTLVFIEP